MNLAYTRHARRRQRQRNISDAEVEAAIAGYSTLRTDAKGNQVYIGYVGSRRIKAVVDVRTDPWTAVTVAD